MTAVRTSLYRHSVHRSQCCWVHLESRTYQRKKTKKNIFPMNNSEISTPALVPGDSIASFSMPERKGTCDLSTSEPAITPQVRSTPAHNSQGPTGTHSAET